MKKEKFDLEKFFKHTNKVNGLTNEKCISYSDHNPVWSGDGFFCSKCGIEFVPREYLYNLVAEKVKEWRRLLTKERKAFLKIIKEKEKTIGILLKTLSGKNRDKNNSTK
ncbi:MAG: hypothetical protein ACTSR2_02835 [Candidatus Hodarchaeales archaeon]